jgi:glutamate racemase
MKKALIITIALSAALYSCKTNVLQADINLPIVDRALFDSTSVYYGEFEEYPENLKMLPIGVFDSGTGGLTVLEKIVSLDLFDNITGKRGDDDILDFAGEHFIYLADQANMPYGNYDAEGKSDYLRELVIKDALFLLDDNYYETQYDRESDGIKPRVKIIVIACNTATAYGLKDITSLLEQSNTGVKVIGVINAGVKATFDQLNISEGEAPFAIGVLATPGTIASGAYQRTIEEMVAERGIKTDVTVVNQKGYGFAEAVDSEPDFVNPALYTPRDSYRGPRIGRGDDSLDISLMRIYNFDFSGNRMLYKRDVQGGYRDIQLNDAVNYARFNLVSLVEKHRLSSSTAPLRAVILGCTHYPFLIETLWQVINELRNIQVNGQYIYKHLIADDFIFIDPAVYTAIECYNTLREDGNLALRIGEQKVDGYISVPDGFIDSRYLTPDGKLTYEFKYGRDVDSKEITTKQVPFSKSNIDSNNLLRIKLLLPYSYELIYPTL